MKLSEYPPKYLFQKKFETRDTQPYNREHEFVYKIDIYENWSENVSEKDIHNELEKQNIFDYENKDLIIEFYRRFRGDEVSIGDHTKYYIPNWMCEIIHDWYDIW